MSFSIHNTTKRTRRSLLALLTVAVISMAGCGGSDGPKMYSLNGIVTLDSQPVSEGQITFRTAKDGRRFVGQIKDGKYEVKAESGEMLVEIIASRVVPGKVDKTTNPGVEEPVTEMYIPKKYNSETTLTTKVDGSSTIPTFELKSK